jgi:hypothetical protein
MKKDSDPQTDQNLYISLQNILQNRATSGIYCPMNALFIIPPEHPPDSQQNNVQVQQ